MEATFPHAAFVADGYAVGCVKDVPVDDIGPCLFNPAEELVPCTRRVAEEVLKFRGKVKVRLENGCAFLEDVELHRG